MQIEKSITQSTIFRFGQTAFNKLLRQRVFRFLVGGGVSLAFNILLISIMI